MSSTTFVACSTRIWAVETGRGTSSAIGVAPHPHLGWSVTGTSTCWPDAPLHGLLFEAHIEGENALAGCPARCHRDQQFGLGGCDHEHFHVAHIGPPCVSALPAREDLCVRAEQLGEPIPSSRGASDQERTIGPVERRSRFGREVEDGEPRKRSDESIATPPARHRRGISSGGRRRLILAAVAAGDPKDECCRRSHGGATGDGNSTGWSLSHLLLAVGVVVGGRIYAVALFEVLAIDARN